MQRFQQTRFANFGHRSLRSKSIFSIYRKVAITSLPRIEAGSKIKSIKYKPSFDQKPASNRSAPRKSQNSNMRAQKVPKFKYARLESPKIQICVPKKSQNSNMHAQKVPKLKCALLESLKIQICVPRMSQKSNRQSFMKPRNLKLKIQASLKQKPPLN